MSMPEFPEPNPDLTREQALNMILSSIAMEEQALSHILHAEGEKIQYLLGKTQCQKPAVDAEAVLAVNKSVTALLEMVMQNQLILKNKMDKVLEYLPEPTPPIPPKPPCPFPPEPPCPLPPAPCPSLCRYEPFALFSVIPGKYPCGSALQWICEGRQTCCRYENFPSDCRTIPLPRSGWIRISISLDFCPVYTNQKTEILELDIPCPEKKPMSRSFRFNTGQHTGFFSGAAVLQMPCSCSPCHACFFLRIPDGLQIRSGKLVLSRI